MPYPDVPHLALPLRTINGRLAVLEQDDLDDVAQCVETVLRFPVGFRDDEPEFGIPDLTFSDVDPDVVAQAIADWEPRADVDLSDLALDDRDEMVFHITAQIMSATSG